MTAVGSSGALRIVVGVSDPSVAARPKRSSSRGIGGRIASTSPLVESAMGRTNRLAAAADDLLAGVRAAAALDEPARRIDLVGAVDGDVQLGERFERLDADAQLGRAVLGGRRGRDASQVAQVLLGQRVEQVRDRRPGPEPDGHPVLDQLRRRDGSSLLLPFDVRHAVILVKPAVGLPFRT